MAISDITTEAVNKAIEEFDRLGRLAFLKRYGFGSARSYVLQKNGRSYDSKAIAGVAHGYLPGQKPLLATEFSGGEATVQAKLGELGFSVIKADDAVLPTPGDILTNAEIVRRFTVGTSGGMRQNNARHLLVLISDPFKGLYQDRWEGDVLHYTGMGPSGNQSLTYARNGTLAKSPSTKIAVHLFEALEPMRYTYVGEAEMADAPYEEEQLGEDKNPRNVWMFPLRLKSGGVVPTVTEAQARKVEMAHAKIARRLSTDELKARAKKAKKTPALRTAETTVYVRDASVAEYTKRLAGGTCDLCETEAPFKNKQNEAYLECHHVIWLAQGGADIIENTVALCPNCHRKMHILNASADREKLLGKAVSRTK